MRHGREDEVMTKLDYQPAPKQHKDRQDLRILWYITLLALTLFAASIFTVSLTALFASQAAALLAIAIAIFSIRSPRDRLSATSAVVLAVLVLIASFRFLSV